MPKPTTKRTITFGPDISITVTKVTEVRMPKRSLFLEELDDGTFRITYSSGLVPDVALLEQMRIGPREE